MFQDQKPQANTLANTNKAIFRGNKTDLFVSIRKCPAYIGSNRLGLVTLIRKTALCLSFSNLGFLHLVSIVFSLGQHKWRDRSRMPQ